MSVSKNTIVLHPNLSDSQQDPFPSFDFVVGTLVVKHASRGEFKTIDFIQLREDMNLLANEDPYGDECDRPLLLFEIKDEDIVVARLMKCTFYSFIEDQTHRECVCKHLRGITGYWISSQASSYLPILARETGNDTLSCIHLPANYRQHVNKNVQCMHCQDEVFASLGDFYLHLVPDYLRHAFNAPTAGEQLSLP